MERENRAERAGQTSHDPAFGRESLHRTPILLAVSTVIASIVYGALTMSPWFDTNDDPAMLAISIGLFNDGVPDPRIVYQSAFLGALLGQLSGLHPGVDWYSGLQWTVCIGGFLTMNAVALRRDASLLTWGSVAAVTSTFLPAFLFNLQFVQTSFVCLMAGMVSLVDALRRPTTGARPFIPAICWLFVAPLFRQASFMAAEIVLLALFVLAVLDRLSRGQPAGLRRDASILGSTAIGLALFVLTVQGLERATFYSDPAWADFVDNLSARPYVVENWPRWIGLERIGHALQDGLGLTPEQYWAMVHWIPISSEWYSVQSFARMAAIIRELDATPESFASLLATHVAIARAFLSDTPIVRAGLGFIGVVTLIGAAARPADRARIVGQGIFWTAFPAVIWLGTSIAFRPPPPRVWLPILALAMWGSLISRVVVSSGPERAPIRWSRREGLAGLALVIALGGPFPIHAAILRKAQLQERLRAARCESTHHFIAAFERIPESATIFLAPRVVHAECFVRPFVLRDYPEVMLERTVSFGWRLLTPTIHEKLFARNSDLFDTVCHDPANAFVANAPTRSIVERYLARHRPEIELIRYSSDLPEEIRACRHDRTKAG